ncbi:MAG TPA: cytochrome P450 [Acidimicrobiales bacterium]|nr:cytochrome P450 [Acidimicrobiales bacterium]
MSEAIHGRVAGAPIQCSFHPVDKADSTCPYAKLGDLRESAPISIAEREGLPTVTVVTKYHDAASIFRNWRAFGNISSDPDTTRHDATPEDERVIIALDPPTHTWVRRLSQLAMAPAAIDEALPYVAEVATQLVAQFAPRGTVELVGEWAEPLPSRAIARVLGLPEEDAAILHGWVASQFTESASAASGRRYGGLINEGGDFVAYLLDQIRRRHRDDAPDDALTRMVRYRRDDGSAFTDAQISTHVRLLLNAGNETTTSLLSNLTFRLLEQPGLYERVAHDRSLLAPAIEESLRLDAPLQVLIRRANHDEVVGETLLRGGDVIALSTLSGNRDEEAWGETADEFDVERFLGPTPAHMGFGVGIHHCVGAYLARQTTMAGLNALLDAIPSMQLEEGYEYENVSYHIFHRPRRLPVTFAARP